jgi:hypothetical protein
VKLIAKVIALSGSVVAPKRRWRDTAASEGARAWHWTGAVLQLSGRNSSSITEHLALSGIRRGKPFQREAHDSNSDRQVLM